MNKVWLLVILSLLSLSNLLHAVEMKKIVYAPKNINEQIDIDEDEAYTLVSFKELIQESEKLNIPYCIVRVKTKDKTSREYVHHYDAQFFNRAIGLDPILLNLGLKRDITLRHVSGYFRSPRNALNELRFEQKDVDYFFINNHTDDQFNFVYSLGQMTFPVADAGKAFVSNLLIANLLITNNDAAARRVGHFMIGEMYFQGSDIPKDYVRAVMHLKRCIDPKMSTGIASKAKNIADASFEYMFGSSLPMRLRNCIAESKFILGTIYSKGGDGVEKDFDRALYYLTAVAHDQEHPDSAASAQLSTGDLYAKDGQYDKALEYFDMVIKGDSAGKRVPLAIRALVEKGKALYKIKRYKEAFDCFSRAINVHAALPAHERMPLVNEASHLFLSKLYYEGNGVEKNYAKVAQYMMLLKDMPGEIGSEAQLLLGLIYYEGGYGVQKDIVAAREYLTKAANQTIFPEVATYALATLSQMKQAAGQPESSSGVAKKNTEKSE